jgi:pimeloyl-ACP methyl ester carboxylesterase
MARSRVRRAEDRYRHAERDVWRSLGLEPSERSVHLATVGSTVRVQEVGHGEPLLFLHGASTSGTSWASLVARLTDFRCLVVDRPGTGLSEPMGRKVRDASDLRAIADRFVADLLDALDIRGAAVVATSFGGLFAFRGALASPAHVTRIIEFGWSAGAPLARMPLVMRLGSLPVLGSLSARVPVNERAVRVMFRAVGMREAMDAGHVSSEAVRAYAALINETATLRNEIALGRAVISPLRGIDPRLFLTEDERRSIRQPVRFIWGDRDVFGGIQIAREFAAAFPDARLEVVAGAGHSPWMDDADVAAELTRRWLTDPARYSLKRSSFQGSASLL